MRADPVRTDPSGAEAMVPVSDGVELSVMLRFPPAAPDGSAAPGGFHPGHRRFPVILDCHPYRKDDLFSVHGQVLYEYFANRGFVTARLDVRGTGRSRGTVPASEYSETEISDCVAVIDWLAGQPWSNGSVGMWGISWSAINTLLVAARRPGALKACIAVHPSDELFARDIHYIDGLLHYDLYELSIDLLNAITPGPDFALDEELLADRFDQPPWMATVLQHQSNDGYWRNRSLAPRYDRIACPVFLVGGWYDGYHECVFRLLDGLKVPVQACVGPWTHVLPNMGGPGDPIDWLAQAADWWDRWLRDDASLSDPQTRQPDRRVQLYARSWHPPAGDQAAPTGNWRTITEWPVPEMKNQCLTLGSGRLRADTGNSPASAGDGDGRRSEAEIIRVDSPPWIGSEVGHWWGDLAEDQAPLDAECVTFDSPPITEAIEILGSPVLRLVTESAPGTHLFARLEDVAPDGRVTLVTGAGTAACHRQAAPAELKVALHWTSWRFDPEHQIRLALSTALWPMFWPAARTGPVNIHVGDPATACLSLPIPPARWGTSEGPPVPRSHGHEPRGAWSRPIPRWYMELHDRSARLTWATGGSSDLGFATMTSSQRLVFAVAGMPDTEASADGDAAMTVGLPGHELTWRIETSLHSAQESYSFRFRRQLIRDGELIRERSWDYGIPRTV
jgi:predicted acyl esterase